jgi:hypothetical protein
MTHRAGYHQWLDPEPLAPGRAKSLCAVCGLTVEHQASKRPGTLAAGRVLDGKRIPALTPIPTCGDVERVKYDARHKWSRQGTAGASKRGFALYLYQCQTCGVQIETTGSTSPMSINHYVWFRYRANATADWQEGKPGACLDIIDDELSQRVRELMPTTPVRTIAEMLGVCTAKVRLRAKLWRERGVPTTRKNHYWTEEDIAALYKSWNPRNLKETARALKRSLWSTMWKARQIGLVDHRGCPRGYEFLSDAEARLGFSIYELETMLAGTAIRSMKALKAGGKRVSTWHVYAIDELDAMVERHLQTVTVANYAASKDMRVDKLGRWISRAGIPKPEGKTARSWRLPIEQLDQVFEAEGWI